MLAAADLAEPACLPFSGSYAPEDVTFLLKPINLEPTEIEAKERLIQHGGRHYSEMISPEAIPDRPYLDLYDQALARNGARLAADIAALAGALAARAGDGDEIVLVSLARAGTPIGVLLVRALRRLGREAAHYSISIIRDRGIDRQALAWIAQRHDPAHAVFIDGWTGKGAIAGELHRSLSDRPFGFAPFLAVVADPAGRADLAATAEDYLIPSGLLNAIVSGLVSRSILNDEVVGPGDFHACLHYRQFAAHDRSRAFVDRIGALSEDKVPHGIALGIAARRGAAEHCNAFVTDLMDAHGVKDRNLIKPGIAEATRAVLRRLPDKLLLRDRGDPDTDHLVHLAAERRIAIGSLPASAPFRAVSIIRSLSGQREAEA